MKATEFTYKDRNGSVSMEIVGQMLRVSFTGACGSGMSKQFYDAVAGMIPNFGTKPWAYLSASPDFVAATPEAFEWIFKAYQHSIVNGCRGEAYVLTSAVAKSQIEKLLIKAGSSHQLDDVIFDNETDAINAVNQQLGQCSFS